MKLVDILARELNVWPEGVARIMQTFAGMTFYQDAEGQIVPLLRISLSDDWRLDEGVTREQWQSAVNANKPNINCRTVTMTKPQLPPGVIPIGATHFHHNPVIEKPTSNPWRKKSGERWLAFYDEEWRGCNGSKAHLFVAIEDVLGKTSGGEWDGEGLPPQGIICEVKCERNGRTDLAWIACEVAYISDHYAILRSDQFIDQKEVVVEPQSCLFRPIRTAEQIAAEEREKEAHSIIESMPAKVCTTGEIVRWMLDSGYRKQVQQ